MMTKSITWLHLSDLHACNPVTGWGAGRIKETLMQDLQRLQKEGLVPDMVFFTGDLAYGNVGKQPGENLQDQYQEVLALLSEIQALYPDLPRRNVFLVPGNHDVDREFVADDQTEWLTRQTDVGVVNRLILQGTVQFQRYMERLCGYTEFLRTAGLNHLLDRPDKLIFTSSRSFQGLTVGIAGLNTAWACCGDKEKGQIWTGGIWQIGHMRGSLKAHQIRVVLMHHPTDWFVPQESTELLNSIEHEFHFSIHGHEHVPGVVVGPGGFTRIKGSTCYDRSDRENGYNMVRLNLSTGDGEVFLRQYDRLGGNWIPRVISGVTDNNGVRRLTHLHWLKKLVSESFWVSAEPAGPESFEHELEKEHAIASKIVLSECIHPSSLRRGGKSGTLFQYIKNIFVQQQKDFLELFTRDAKEVEDFEQHLYVEPAKYIYRIDYVWEDIKRRGQRALFHDYTNTDELFALVSDGEKKTIFIMGDIACGKTTFVHRFRGVFKQRIKTSLCIDLDFAPWRGKVNSGAEYNRMKHEYMEELEYEIRSEVEDGQLQNQHLEYFVQNVKHKSFIKSKRKLDEGGELNYKEIETLIDEWQKENLLKSVALGFRFLRDNGYNILLILDNVDPLPVCYQERFAQDALEMTHLSNIQIVVPLRFYSLDLIANIAGMFRCCIFMKLDLPSIRDIITKRVKYFVFDRLDLESYTITWHGTSLTVGKAQLVKMISYINRNLLTDELINTFICLSDMNIRFILLNYRSILDSRHVDLDPETVHLFYEGDYEDNHIFHMRSYDLLLKSVITDRRILYRQKISRVENLFNVYSVARGDFYPNLLKTYLLEIVFNLSVSKVGTEVRKDFVDKGIVMCRATDLGWDKVSVDAALEEMFFKSLLFGYESDLFDFNTRFALSSAGYHYRSTVHLMVYYMYFMAFDFPLDAKRIEKYFDKVTGGPLVNVRYRLRRKYQPLLNDKLIHLLVGEFLIEFAELEARFMQESLNRPEAIKVFRNCIIAPVSLRMIESFQKHCKERRYGGVARVMAELKTVETRMRKLAIYYTG